MSEYISAYTGEEIDQAIKSIEEVNSRIDDIKNNGLPTSIQVISFNGSGQPFTKSITLNFVPTIVKLYYASASNENVSLSGVFKPASSVSSMTMTSLWKGNSQQGGSFNFTPNSRLLQFTGVTGYYVLEAIR